ncbi:phage tail protein I [Campylobacter sp. MIT 99-7217]|uniref:phage tail protein I n=1 Tax=Campylobacter sp. MIT 99-7217 TaxID=535091 RepID=UPI00115709FE|nr:phage tail protein I [Campylobacter sp. MIT 99-7217]TQR29152.1 phage tail protein I [Campylobacter sp. MIT 99-7217]
MSLILAHHPKQSKAIDLSAKARFEDLNLASITNLALNCDKRLLPVLANAYDVSIDGLEEKEARKLISKALLLDRYNGTAFAIKEALKTVFDTATLKEWFEYEGKPYHFKVKVTSKDKPFNQRTFTQLDRLILEYKNVRSVLESITLELQSPNESFNASVSSGSEKIELLPYQRTKIEPKAQSFMAMSAFVAERLHQTLNTQEVR